MINHQQSIEMIRKMFPSFFTSKVWEQHLEFWADENPGFGNIISTFSDYCIELFLSKREDELKSVFLFVEEMLKNGDVSVRDAFATCFLENILNLVPSKISPIDFIPLLGPSSIDYCRAWDEFTGVKTPGLTHEDFI